MRVVHVPVIERTFENILDSSRAQGKAIDHIEVSKLELKALVASNCCINYKCSPNFHTIDWKFLSGNRIELGINIKVVDNG